MIATVIVEKYKNCKIYAHSLGFKKTRVNVLLSQKKKKSIEQNILEMPHFFTGLATVPNFFKLIIIDTLVCRAPAGALQLYTSLFGVIFTPLFSGGAGYLLGLCYRFEKKKDRFKRNFFNRYKY